MGLAGEGKDCKCIDGQSEWTGAFVDGQNVGRVERSLRSEVRKEEFEQGDGKVLLYSRTHKAKRMMIM